MDNTVRTALYIVIVMGFLFPYVLKKGTLPKSEWLGKMWKDHGKETARSLGIIVVSILLFNWLCSEAKYEWWWTFWRKGSIFWISQVTVVFAIYAIMATKKFMPRFASFVLLALVVGSWINVVARSDSPSGMLTETERIDRLLAEPETDPIIRTVMVKAGKWHKFNVPDGMALTTSLEPAGTAFTLRVNDDPTEYRSEPGVSYLDMDAILPGVPKRTFWLQPDTDVEVTAVLVPKG